MICIAVMFVVAHIVRLDLSFPPTEWVPPFQCNDVLLLVVFKGIWRLKKPFRASRTESIRRVDGQRRITWVRHPR
ncbi:hypothetical protein J3E72DRAFT_363117 [Bipolaris maydis]|uniref:uncharacterized protein n=1 Tax=Cochliobolus heterostrophus TaxID=5016 RepID=UPI0024D7A643|nr:hypothetical protein J3E73DRAFT_283667 [Bipolaris maydis]KAJ5062027.1 hypothetical protein J3E74DRAFT_332175 [Bipolaris maydis]KAJ6192638.1 hypothetical protein J3E72DRAFT_363117 [Bipolaris maydis]KAJ6215003.1 hypothetical protein PSV09DRAFT_2270575 [Bipolaris maydis]KAJ6276147.1 hypothetical protein PSV08DRAFT_259804 [Bipolaris maydis]